MPDEFYEQYRRYTHRELYSMLTAGSPGQVEELVTTWKSMETTISGLSASLRADLDRLLGGWDSPAGREFDRRVGLVASYAQVLAEEFATIQTGLTAMSSALTDAQSKAEHPDAIPDTLRSHSAQGSGVIGGQMGRELTETERELARERMVLVLSGLAAEYRVTDFGTWPPAVPPPPPDTPAAPPAADQHAAAPVAMSQTKSSPVSTAPAPAAAPVTTPVAQTTTPMVVADTVVPVPGYDPNAGVIVETQLAATEPEDDDWFSSGPALATAAGVITAGTIVATAVSNRGSKDDSISDDRDDGRGADHEVGNDGVIRQGHDAMPVEMAATPMTSELASGGQGSSTQPEGQTSTTTQPPPPAATTGFGTPGAPGTPGATVAGSGPVSGHGGGAHGGSSYTAAAHGAGSHGGTASYSGGGSHQGGSYSGGAAGGGTPSGQGGTPTGGPGTGGGSAGGPTSLASANSSGFTNSSADTGSGLLGSSSGDSGGGSGAGDRTWMSEGRIDWSDDEAVPDSRSLIEPEDHFDEDAR